MTKARLTEVFDDQGNLLRIVVEDSSNGRHLFDALWDPQDEQDQSNRDQFRAWVTKMVVRKGYTPIN